MGRGDFLVRHGCVKATGSLQRGRAFWGAEISGLPILHVLHRTASTGPRLLGRGDKRGAEIHGWLRHTSFNGAAPFGARRSCLFPWRSPTQLSFNGAAPFGARRCRPRYTADRMPGLLQRGRAFWGAEIKSGGSAGPGWGWLQRGRAFWGAEIRTSLERFILFTLCFNGAAPFGARRSRWGNPHKLPPEQLQRGRAFWGAEIWRIRLPRHALGWPASTGPRLLGRGDPMIPRIK